MINGEYSMVIAPQNYPGKKYRGKYCYEHHLVYWQHYEVIPKKDEIIHHKNENKFDNDISNLELLKRKKHSEYHNKKRKVSYILLKCPYCSKEFVKQKRNTFIIKGGQYTCCSRKCIGKIEYLKKHNIKEFNKRISNNIIKEFKDYSENYINIPT